MNNQRRHELEHNALAGYLGTALSKVQHLFKPIAIAAVVSGAVFAAYSIYQSVTSKKSATAWTEYYFNLDGDASSFQDLAENYGNSSAGQWARLSAATGFLRDGIDALYVNREEGVSNIKRAIEELEGLKGTSIPELQTQVLHGLGKAHESLGQLPEASAYYQQLTDVSSLSDDERKQINDRLSYLGTDEAKTFYAWFEKLDPKPASPPQLPGDLSVPPDSPSIQFDPAGLPAIPEVSELPNSPPMPPTPETPVVVEPPAVELPAEPKVELPVEPQVELPSEPQVELPDPSDPETEAPQNNP
jgi:hypothetical protein